MHSKSHPIIYRKGKAYVSLKFMIYWFIELNVLGDKENIKNIDNMGRIFKCQDQNDFSWYIPFPLKNLSSKRHFF